MKLMASQRPDIFNNLLEEAKTTFPELAMQIEETYSQYPKKKQNQELVTQSLSRYFREDLGKSKKRHNSFKEFVLKFIAWVKGLFNIDVLPTFNKNKFGNNVIPLSSLQNIYSLQDMATVLNTQGISFYVSEGLSDEVTYHLEENL